MGNQINKQSAKRQISSPWQSLRLGFYSLCNTIRTFLDISHIQNIYAYPSCMCKCLETGIDSPKVKVDSPKKEFEDTEVFL